jgi:hypothetical protein
MPRQRIDRTQLRKTIKSRTSAPVVRLTPDGVHPDLDASDDT